MESIDIIRTDYDRCRLGGTIAGQRKINDALRYLKTDIKLLKRSQAESPEEARVTQAVIEQAESVLKAFDPITSASGPDDPASW